MSLELDYEFVKPLRLHGDSELTWIPFSSIGLFILEIKPLKVEFGSRCELPTFDELAEAFSYLLLLFSASIT